MINKFEDMDDINFGHKCLILTVYLHHCNTPTIIITTPQAASMGERRGVLEHQPLAYKVLYRASEKRIPTPIRSAKYLS